MKNLIFIALFSLAIACTSAEGNKTGATNDSADSKTALNSKPENNVPETIGSNKEAANTKTKASPKVESVSDRDSVSGKEVTGTFEMKFTNEGLDATNEIKIAALGDNKLKVEFDLSYPVRVNNERSSVNIGKAQGEAVIEGDTAVYSTNEKDGKCEIKIKFVKQGLIKVSQNQEGSGCGFGLNVSAQGAYKKVSGEKPVFSSSY